MPEIHQYFAGFDDCSKVLGFVFCAAVGSWLVGILYLIQTSKNEVRLGRRTIIWQRATAFLLAGCNALQLHYDVQEVQRRQGDVDVSLPVIQVIRPVMGLVLAAVALMANTHHFFRWFAIITPLFLAGLSIAYAAQLQVLVKCREAGTCLSQDGYTTEELTILLWTNHVHTSLCVWLVLLTCIISMVMGWRGPRYPVALFSVTASLAAITHKARGAGSEEEKANAETDSQLKAAARRAKRRALAKGGIRARISAVFRIMWDSLKDYIEDWLAGYQ